MAITVSFVQPVAFCHLLLSLHIIFTGKSNYIRLTHYCFLFWSIFANLCDVGLGFHYESLRFHYRRNKVRKETNDLSHVDQQSISFCMEIITVTTYG